VRDHKTGKAGPMPIYEYAAAGEACCAKCRTPFEVFQAMSAPPLERCPECGAEVAKLLSASAVHGGATRILSNRNIAEKGFTKYQRAGDGVYEKVAGKGPNVIAGR